MFFNFMFEKIFIFKHFKSIQFTIYFLIGRILNATYFEKKKEMNIY